MNRLSLRQQEIIFSALDIIAEKGLENFTIKNLAKARGVSEPSLYRHFESKQSILILAIYVYRNSIFDLFDSFLETEIPAIEKISSFYISIIHRFSEKPLLSSLLFSEEFFLHNKLLTREMYLFNDMLHARIEKVLKNGRRKKEFRSEISCKDLAWIITGAMKIVITRWRFSGYSYDPVKECKSILKSLKQMIH